MNEMIDIVIEDGKEFIKGIDIIIYDDFVDFDIYFDEELLDNKETTLI